MVGVLANTVLVFCPLIPLDLERAEVLRAFVPFSVGGRAQILPDQAQFWQRNVPHVIEALVAHFSGFSSSDPRAITLSSRESWGVGGDHLSPLLQESVVPGEVLSMMTLWLTEQVAQFQRDSVPNSPKHTNSLFNQPGASVVPPAQAPSPFNGGQPTPGVVSGGVVVSHLFLRVVNPTDLPAPSTSFTAVNGAGPRRLTPLPIDDRRVPMSFGQTFSDARTVPHQSQAAPVPGISHLPDPSSSRGRSLPCGRRGSTPAISDLSPACTTSGTPRGRNGSSDISKCSLSRARAISRG